MLSLERKESRKAFVFISSNGFTSRLQQVFLLATGFQCGYINFREQVCVLCGAFCWIFLKFLNLCESLIQTAGIVRELSVHQRTFCGEGTLHLLKRLRRSQSESLPSVAVWLPSCVPCLQVASPAPPGSYLGLFKKQAVIKGLVFQFLDPNWLWGGK